MHMCGSSSSTATTAVTASSSSFTDSTPSTSSTAVNDEPSSSLQRVTIPQPVQRLMNRPAPVEGESEVCFEGESVSATTCCHKPVCNDCLINWMNQRKTTCPYCRQKLPNDMIIHSQEGSDALLNDPDFQRRIRAVSLSFRCLLF